MKVLIDTCVLLDVLCNRKDFAEDSLKVFKYCETNQITGYISALSIPNIVYIMRKELDNERIKEILTILTSVFTIVDLRQTDLIRASELDFSDYEDAVQSVCASRIKANYIVTRNIKDFKSSAVTAIKPSELIERI
jgi:predicted nucleic acid-binding protein